jgi:hypothetical protein
MSSPFPGMDPYLEDRNIWPDVALDPNAAIRAAYARAGYDWRLNYRRPVPPPELQPAMAACLTERLPQAL